MLSGNIDAETHAVRIGPTLIFDRLWHELGENQQSCHQVAKRREVKIGARRPGEVEIVDGLKAICDYPRHAARPAGSGGENHRRGNPRRIP